MDRRRYATAHELRQFVYAPEAALELGPPCPEEIQRGPQVHARLEAAHMGHPPAAENAFPWDWVAVGAFFLLVLGVALWTH